MFTRRTVVSLVAVAALAGGASGSVATSITSPQTASADDAPAATPVQAPTTTATPLRGLLGKLDAIEFAVTK